MKLIDLPTITRKQGEEMDYKPRESGSRVHVLNHCAMPPLLSPKLSLSCPGPQHGTQSAWVTASSLLRSLQIILAWRASRWHPRRGAAQPPGLSLHHQQWGPGAHDENETQELQSGHCEKAGFQKELERLGQLQPFLLHLSEATPLPSCFSAPWSVALQAFIMNSNILKYSASAPRSAKYQKLAEKVMVSIPSPLPGTTV